MERVTAILIIFSMNFAIQSLPIENGFSVKFNPVSVKEDLKPRKFGAMFAKIPQDFKADDANRREVLTKAYFPQKSEVPSGYSNQVAKLLFPTKYIYSLSNNNLSNNNNSSTTSPRWTNRVNFLNLPIVRQPYDDYKILVATAPRDVHLGGDNKRTIIYVVFPEDGSSDTGLYNIPTIYFVNEKNGKTNPVRKLPVDPILIIDSNRTVTGLKSKEVSKYVRFKNKWTDRYNYKIAR